MTVQWVVVAAVVVVLVAALLSRGRRRQVAQPLVFFVLAAGSMLGIGYLFVLAWDTYVPRRTGSQRLFLEATLVVPVFLAGAASTVGRYAGDRVWGRRVVTGALLVLALAGGLFSALEIRGEADDWSPRSDDRAALEAVDVPAGSVLVSNAYTEGYLSHVTGGAGLLEGRAPYTFPGQLERSLRLLREAKAFYADPAGNQAFLDRYDVDYVLYSEPGSFSVTSANTFDDAAGVEELREVPGLEEVVSSPGLVVFRHAPR